MDFKIPLNNVPAEDNWMFKSSSWNIRDEYTYTIPQKYTSKPSIDIKRLHSINKLNDKIKRHASLKQEISTISSTMFFGNEEEQNLEKKLDDETKNYKDDIKNKIPRVFSCHIENDKKIFYEHDTNFDLNHSSSSVSDTSLNEIYSQRHFPIQQNIENNEEYLKNNNIRRHKTLDNVHFLPNYYNYIRPTYSKTRRSQSYHCPAHNQNLIIQTNNLESCNYLHKKPKMLRRDSIYYNMCDICSRTHKRNDKCSKYAVSFPLNTQIVNETYLPNGIERTSSNYNKVYSSHNPYRKPSRSRSPQILRPDTLHYKYVNNNQSQNHTLFLENGNTVKNMALNDNKYYIEQKSTTIDQTTSYLKHKDSTIIRPANAGPAWKLKKYDLNDVNRHPSPIFRYGKTPLSKSLYDYDVYAREMKEKAAERRTKVIIAIVVCLIAFVIVICAGVILATTYHH